MLIQRLVQLTALTMTMVDLPSSAAAQLAAADSQRVNQAARSAQLQFERTRRSYMRWAQPTYGPCEIRIGRYCLSNVDWGDDESWTAPVEDPAVAAARFALIALLDSASGVLPDDSWIAGQRVRYLIEAKKPGRALAAARDCRSAEYWWCLALAGFAFYAANDFAQSESAYAAALAMMDEAGRCEWSDLSGILAGKIGARYRDLSCSERASLQRRILWLADPFYSVPGNELSAEHYSRQVHSALISDAESPEGDRWGADLHRFVMRYGWTFGWERLRTTSRWTHRPQVRGHFGHGAKYFLPQGNLVDEPTGVIDVEWKLEPRRPQAGHIPPYAISAFDSLPHQLAAFLRGDSLLITAAFELTADSVPDDARVHAAMIFQRDETAPQLGVRDTIFAKTGSLSAAIPFAPHILSLEVLAQEEKRAARARYSVLPTQLITTSQTDPSEPANVKSAPPGFPLDRALSGWLLTRVEDSLAETLEAALAVARPNNRLNPGERFGLYWELYGTGPSAERISTSLTLSKQGKSLLRRVAGIIGLGSDKPPVSLEWQDVTSGENSFFPRAVAVDLPQGLSRGQYVLQLTLEFEDGDTIRLEKRLQVTTGT